MLARRGHRICLLSGKNTNQLAVKETRLPDGVIVTVTDLERTLVDIVVRPAYSGGIAKVLEAYRAASKRVSVTRLATLLTRLDHAYPYRQAVGFCLEASGGFTSKELQRMAFALPSADQP